MSAPRLVACYFTPPGAEGDRWQRMAWVLEHSAARHCAGWEVVISRLDPAAPRSARHSQSDDCNTQKLDHWADAVASAPEGMPILLIDSDTVIVGDLSPIWSQPFDLAYTLRERGARLPLNAGVVFLRASPAVKRFVTAWRQENGRMLEDRAYHERWRRLYGGINQAALGKLLDSGVSRDLGLTLAQLPCRTWNCEDSAWQHFGPHTRIIHCKSSLRRAIFNVGPTVRRLAPLVKVWRAVERGATPQVERR